MRLLSFGSRCEVDFEGGKNAYVEVTGVVTLGMGQAEMVVGYVVLHVFMSSANAF